jgi:hypothetical protein
MKPLFSYLCLSLIFLAGTQALAYDSKTYTEKNHHAKSSSISEIQLSDMDGDKNGSVSFDEFKAAFPSIQQNVFNILDKDKDRQLNETEWQAFKDMHKGMG